MQVCVWLQPRSLSAYWLPLADVGRLSSCADGSWCLPFFTRLRPTLQNTVQEYLNKVDHFLEKFPFAQQLEEKTKIRKSHLAALALAAAVGFLFLFLGLEFVRRVFRCAPQSTGPRGCACVRASLRACTPSYSTRRVATHA
jgi:hypothetical protein